MMEKIAYRWNEEKNRLLKQTRGIGFEDVVDAIRSGDLLADIPNPRYVGQRLLAINIKGYAIVVPYIPGDGEMFFKTLYPDRKAKRRLLDNPEK